MKLVRGGLITMITLIALVATSLALQVNNTNFTPAERMALKIDAALDKLETPRPPTIFELQKLWPLEISPYFEYEGLTSLPTGTLEVVLEPQVEGMYHQHIAGYTYCDSQVFLNFRFVNPISAWNETNPTDSLAVLVHEMVHTLDGDFCSFDSETAESRTQLGTLEVLAAMANGGNEVAQYAFLAELRDIAMNTVLFKDLTDDNLDAYREFRALIFPNEEGIARFEKSMRHWESDMSTLMGILDRYSVSVFDDLQDGEFKAVMPGDEYTNRNSIVVMDDLVYILQHLDDLTNKE